MNTALYQWVYTCVNEQGSFSVVESSSFSKNLMNVKIQQYHTSFKTIILGFIFTFTNGKLVQVIS